MAYNPYNLTRMAPAAAPAPGAGRYSLPRQAPLTQSGQLEEDQNAQGLRTGQFADVQSAAGATQRANAMRSSQALQSARGTVARAGGDLSPEAAIRAQDQAFASAGAQNLQADNQVNQLQRQYRQDALNKADTIEGRAQDTNKYNLSRQDSNNQFAVTSGMNQQQINNQANQFQQNYTAGRQDAATQQNQFGENLAQRQQEFGVTSGQNQQQINNQAGQYLQSLSQRDKEFGVTSGQNQQQINNQVDQFGLSLADSQNKFNLTRQDQNSQFAVTSGQNQQQINNQANQFDQNYAANREDAATQKDQFGQTLADSQNKFNLSRQDQNSQFAVTSGQNQQQIENQASQAAAQMGYNYASLSQQDKEYLQTMVQRQSEFGVTSGQNQQQIENQANQFNQNYAANRADTQYAQGRDTVADSRYNQAYSDQRGDLSYDRANAQRLEGKTDSLAAINAIQDPKARQAAYDTYMQGGDVSKFITGTLYDSKGGLNQNYQSASPAQQAAQGRLDDLKSYYPKQTGETDTAYDQRIGAMAQKQGQAEYEASTGPVQDAALAHSVQSKLSSGQTLTPDEKAYGVKAGLVNTYTAKSLPKNESANALKGQQVNVDGQVYTVVGGSRYISGSTDYGSDTHTDYTILDQGGKRIYVLGDGTIKTTEPQDK